MILNTILLFIVHLMEFLDLYLKSSFIFNKKDEVFEIIKNSIKDTNGHISYSLNCSCLEIYQENLVDLLNVLSADQKLSIREDTLIVICLRSL
mgnify:CR=1 FL=1